VPGQGKTIYDPTAGYQVKSIHLPTASGKEHETSFTYDARDRLDTITVRLCAVSQQPCAGGNILSTLVVNDYAYDDNDNRTVVIENNGAGSVTRYYCYDFHNRLEKVSTSSASCASGVTETYAYDAAGNRTGVDTWDFTYNSEGQLESCTGANCAPEFDAEGRLTKITLTGPHTWSYLYDAEGRLTSACKSTSCTGTGFYRLDSTYNAEGHRIRLVETPDAGTATTIDFTYEGDKVVREVETGPTEVITRTFTVDEAGTIRKMVYASVPADATNDGTYLVTYNGHGDAVLLSKVDTDGTLLAANRFTYTTWGTPTTSLVGSYGDLGFRYRYVGAHDVQWDGYEGAGLLYMHARHYHPEFGRFLQPDPSELEANHYAYAENNPVTKIDPSGTITICRYRFAALWLICTSLAASRAITVATAGRVAPVITTATDALGRVRHASATLTPANIGTGTRVTAAARRVTPKGFDTGHLIARILGGGGGDAARNTVTMLSKLNRGDLAQFEKWLANHVRAGNVIQVRVRPIYQGSSNIPIAIEYWWRPLASGAPWIKELIK
jgi:RHS repeat-associated protein